MKAKQSTTGQRKRELHKLAMAATLFNTAAPMNREQRREAERHNRKLGAGRAADELHNA